MDHLEALLRGRDTTGIKVSIDVEETVADVSAPVLRVYNKEKGTSYTIDDIKDWSFRSIGATVPEMMALFDKVWMEHTSEIRCEADPKLMQGLCRYYDCNMATGRTGVDCYLKGWLAMNNLNGMPLIIMEPPSKEKTAINFDIFIDDSPNLAKEIVSTRGFMFLIDRPWNRDAEKCDRILRVPNVNVAAGMLIDRAKRSKILNT